MNAALPTTAPALDSALRAQTQAQLVQALGRELPAHALLWHGEDTVPYECDGLTAYRQRPLLVALPETEAQVSAVLRIATRWRCRWWRAVRAPACRAARCRMRWA
ncbi:hypothetical protein ACVBEH_16830 [Roseateles sp. GG27B]